MTFTLCLFSLLWLQIDDVILYQTDQIYINHVHVCDCLFVVKLLKKCVNILMICNKAQHTNMLKTEYCPWFLSHGGLTSDQKTYIAQKHLFWWYLGPPHSGKNLQCLIFPALIRCEINIALLTALLASISWFLKTNSILLLIPDYSLLLRHKMYISFAQEFPL